MNDSLLAMSRCYGFLAADSSPHQRPEFSSGSYWTQEVLGPQEDGDAAQPLHGHGGLAGHVGGSQCCAAADDAYIRV